ncbi:MAG TPA: YggT family protein [Cellulomonas sp.]
MEIIHVVRQILSLVVVLFLIFLLARAVLDWVQVFARDWRPKGASLVVAEAVYTVTDPPLKLLRRVIPPLRLGTVSLDVAYMVLFAICWVLLIFL